MNIDERIAHHRRMAEAYRDAYLGHTKDGVKMGFYSYSFIETNDEGELIRWETHVNDEYNAFLDVAIGVHGPFHGTREYVDALERCLAKAGVSA